MPFDEDPDQTESSPRPYPPDWPLHPDQSEPGEQVDLAELMGQVAQMQQGLAEAQASAASQEVEGASGGGAVRIRATGALEFTSVRIDPAAVDPGDVTLLEDLVLAAIHDTATKVRDLNQAILGPLGLGRPDSPLGL